MANVLVGSKEDVEGLAVRMAEAFGPRAVLKHRREKLMQQRASMKAYLRMKDETDDMHGVADAAMDIREIDAKLELLMELEQ